MSFVYGGAVTGGGGATTTALATVAELAAYTQEEISDDDAGALLALRIASGLVRSEAGQVISYVADDVISLVVYSPELVLPERPVVDVTSVNGGTSFTRTGSTVALGSVPLDVSWTGYPRTVTVVYSHGYDPVPDEIVGVVLAVASRQYPNVDESRAGFLLPGERQICRRYRRTAQSVLT